MSIRAVADYYVSLLNGKTFGNFPAVSCVDEFPIVAQAGKTPQLFVWCGKGKEYRKAGGRGPTSGFREADHHVAIYGVIAFKASATLSIRDLVEGIVNLLRTTPMPVLGVNDSVTARKTDIVSLGENLTYDIDPPVALRQQRLTGYAFLIEDDVREFLPG